MAPTTKHLAIDLGAGSGRALLGAIDGRGLTLQEVHRFQYAPRVVDRHLRWDAARLVAGLRESLGRAGAAAADADDTLASIGVDGWGVDYALLDEDGRLLEDPVCYRDGRTHGVMEAVYARVPADELFARTGIQRLPINTLFQLFAHATDGIAPRASRLLLIPDLCHHVLCGSMVTEHTNASTTQLLDPRSGRWNDALFDRLGLPRGLMPDIVPTGSRLGHLRLGLRAETGLGALPVIAPGTHDTASAVAGTPLRPGWAYISSGTWSLVGVERREPLIDDRVARANFTNEGGVLGTVRFLKNVMGLWILESCRAEWEAAGEGMGYDELFARVAAVPGFCGLIFPDDPRFFHPPSMGGAVRAGLTETGQEAPDDPVRLAKVILDSLALRYASVLTTVEALTGQPIPGVHIVGGGSCNDYLNQATADASARPVLAGPVEATAIGNVLMQALASGGVASLAEGRRLVAASVPGRRFEPRPTADWADAWRRYREIASQ